MSSNGCCHNSQLPIQPLRPRKVRGPAPNETVLKRQPLTSINIALAPFLTPSTAQKCSISKRYTGWLSGTERIPKNILSLFPVISLRKLLNERHGLFTYTFGRRDTLLFRSHSILIPLPTFLGFHQRTRPAVHSREKRIPRFRIVSSAHNPLRHSSNSPRFI